MSDDSETREEILADWCGEEYSEAGRRTLLAELDRADPLRRLLADEAKMVGQPFSDSRLLDAARRAIEGAPVGAEGERLTRVFCEEIAQRAVLAVLATLREVAD